MVLNPPDDTAIARHPLAEAQVSSERMTMANAIVRTGLVADALVAETTNYDVGSGSQFRPCAGRYRN